MGNSKFLELLDASSLHNARLHIDLRLVEAAVQLEAAALPRGVHRGAHWRLAAAAHHRSQLKVFVGCERSKLTGDDILAGAGRRGALREEPRVVVVVLGRLFYRHHALDSRVLNRRHKVALVY